MSNREAKIYLGDGVYAERDSFGVWLTTERENGTHRIYLEPDMLTHLTKWLTGTQWTR